LSERHHASIIELLNARPVITTMSGAAAAAFALETLHRAELTAGALRAPRAFRWQADSVAEATP